MGFPEDSTIYILVFPTATSHHWQCETGLRIYLFQSTLRNPRVKVSGRHFQLHNLQAILCQSHLWAVMWWLGFPGSSAGKESACNVRDPSSIPGSGRSPGEGISYPLQYSWASLVAQMAKNPPAMRETWVWSLGWEDPLEESMATHSSILAWRVPFGQRSLAGYSPWGRQESDMAEWLSTA